MNQANHHNEQALGNPVPLFASSWIALFVLLRENLSKGGGWNPSADVSPKAGSVGRSH